MKLIKYFACISLFFVLGVMSCYEDKGSYNYEEWSGIESVTGITIPGSSYGRVSISEGDLFEMDPKVTFKKGVSPDNYSYAWVMGGDTIGTSLKLSWVVTMTGIEFLSDYAYFWLAIQDKTTGETWKHYAISPDSKDMVQVKIVPTAMPLIGVMVYEKSDGTLEWGSIKGSNPAAPQQFTSLFTEMFKRYNPNKTIAGPFVGATLDRTQLSIYTRDASTYGTMIQIAAGQTYPFGQSMGSIQNITFMEKPISEVRVKNGYFNQMQEILIGNELFFSTMDNNYPYQLINPNGKGNESDVEQTMGALPYNRMAHMSLQRRTDGHVYYYCYDETQGYKKQPLLDGNGQPLKVDKMVGLYHQPANFSGEKLKFFFVAKNANSYKMYVYNYQQFSKTPDVVEFLLEKDVTGWAGGMNDETVWFGTVLPIGWNYAYIAKGKDLWRYSFEGLENPAVVKSFPDEIVTVLPVGKVTRLSGDGTDEYYTVVFTYNAVTKLGSMYVVNARTAEVEDFSSCVDAIPGKVLTYIPYYTD